VNQPSPKDRKKRILKWLAILAVAPSVALFVMVSLFIARAEMAHDESTCPFDEVERRNVEAGIWVLDQARQCQEGIEEHRWIVAREGGGEREIGRRRLESSLYGAANYRWNASLRDGWVHVRIQNSGVEGAAFREGPE